MTDVVYLDSAIYDMIDAKDSIRAYFISKESPELIENHIKKFQEELDHKLELLKDNPRLYAIRKSGIFKNTQENFRVFTAYWFTVFYTYDNNKVYLWYIRSQKADYRELLNY